LKIRHFRRAKIRQIDERRLDAREHAFTSVRIGHLRYTDTGGIFDNMAITVIHTHGSEAATVKPSADDAEDA
jgi:hypothetical protein